MALADKQGAIKATSGPKKPRRHAWQTIALGRVCAVCMLVQAHDEIDDAVPCAGSRQLDQEAEAPEPEPTGQQ